MLFFRLKSFSTDLTTVKLYRFSYLGLIILFYLCLVTISTNSFAVVTTIPKNGTEYKKALTALNAYQKYFPSKVTDIKYQNGDLTVLVNGKLFYWAFGRLLPADNRSEWSSYKGYDYHHYSLKLLPPTAYPQSLYHYLYRVNKNVGKKGNGKGTLKKTKDFQGEFIRELYGGYTREEIVNNITNVTFLGKQVEVNKLIAPYLSSVENDIYELAKNNKTIQTFLDNIRWIGGFSYRTVAGSTMLSLHSYGLAIDILPDEEVEKNRAIYWQWTRDNMKIKRYFEVPLTKRWLIPEPIVAIFKNHGFTYGGHWVSYDNMHFEFTPALLALSGVR